MMTSHAGNARRATSASSPGPDPRADVAPPEEARALFGDTLPTVRRYADLLADTGVERGLIGPREVPRLWQRHLMNCAVVEELIPRSATVVDIGSGAGLPGVILGIMRPDLSVTLLEPLLRRTVFLRECLDQLALENVSVRRGRAEELGWEHATGEDTEAEAEANEAHEIPDAAAAADIVTARAVAPLSRLAGWALPMLRTGGSLLALKGEQAEAELERARGDLSKQRPWRADVIRVGRGKVDPATTVVRVTVVSRNDRPAARTSPRAPGGRKKRGRKR